MFSKIVIICSIFFFHFHLLAQNNDSNQTKMDYREFKDIFQKEIKDIDKDTNIHFEKYILHPANLPDWLFDLPASSQNIIYTLGISDPGMQEEDAIQLAEHRAKIITALILQPKISSMIDNYSNEQTTNSAVEFTTKYLNYFSILSLLSASKNNFEIVDQYFTSFNEAIVLIKYEISTLTTEKIDSIFVDIDVYQAERQKYNKFEMEEKYEIVGLIKTDEKDITVNDFYYSIHSLNNIFEITSRYNSEELQFQNYNFRYKGQNNNQLPIFDNLISNKLIHGLWKAFIEVLLQKILMLSQSHSMEIKQVGDDYSSRTQNLSREISESMPSFKIINIQVNNNRLYVDLDFL